MRSRLTQQLRWAPRAGQLVARELAAALPGAEALEPQGFVAPLTPRDTAIFLLQIAAEIEHALLVQYLYAYFSLRDSGLTPERQAQVDRWRGILFEIAQEEMAHLVSVQNLLRFVGGPISLEREDYPFRSDLYPFHFQLEPLTRDALAKYAFAEMPAVDPGQVPPGVTRAEYEEIRSRAALADPGNPLNHVGPLYRRIREIFASELTQEDFRPETLSYQATPDAWRGHPGLLILPVSSREDALRCIDQIAEQGEGPGMEQGATASHYLRFLSIYREFPEPGDWMPARWLPSNPNTSPQPHSDPVLERGRIRHHLAVGWAQLLNHRYRMLLADLAHSLSLDQDGGGTRRPEIRNWAFREMAHLTQLSGILMGLPLRSEQPQGPFAGPPFELPYTLQLPELEADRWLLQRDLIRDADALSAAIRRVEQDAARLAVLQSIQAEDQARLSGVIMPRLAELLPRRTVSEIKELRILPALAIGRLGSSPVPLACYSLVPNPDQPDGYRRIQPEETLVLDRATGEIVRSEVPDTIRFRDDQGQIHPVAPFLEVWARFTDDGPLEPLTVARLTELGLTPADVRWQVRAANHKVFRRTRQENDQVTADTGAFSDHGAKPLNGQSPSFKAGKQIPFGEVQYVKPTNDFPEIRLRFTPGAGKVYGPTAGDPNVVDDVYDGGAGTWTTYQDPPDDPGVTIPINVYARNANDVSLGYLDDTCDGIVSVEVAVPGQPAQRGYARVTVGPPDFAPDSQLVRTIADEFEQMLFGPAVTGTPEVEEVLGIVRRALETMRLMNTEYQNRTFGRNAFTPSQADYAHARSRHSDVLLALEGLKAPANSPERATAVGALQLVLTLLRQHTQVADPSPEARRMMPALMRGADGRRLALTRRQRAIIEKATKDFAPPAGPGPTPGGETEQAMINLIISLRANAIRHFKFLLEDGRRLSDLFQDPPALLNYLRTSAAKGDIVPAVKGTPLVVPGKPEESAFITLLSTPGHPMNPHFSGTDPGTGKPRIEVVRDWIRSLS